VSVRATVDASHVSLADEETKLDRLSAIRRSLSRTDTTQRRLYDEQNALFVELYQAGVTQTKIARAAGLTHDAIRMALIRQGVK